MLCWGQSLAGTGNSNFSSSFFFHHFPSLVKYLLFLSKNAIAQLLCAVDSTHCFSASQVRGGTRPTKVYCRIVFVVQTPACLKANLKCLHALSRSFTWRLMLVLSGHLHLSSMWEAGNALSSMTNWEIFTERKKKFHSYSLIAFQKITALLTAGEVLKIKVKTKFWNSGNLVWNQIMLHHVTWISQTYL